MPRYISANAIEQLVATCDPMIAAGARDRAVILLLAWLGLRAGDVRDLRWRTSNGRKVAFAACGNDLICGGEGKDKRVPGRDRLDGGLGRDTCDGGPGTDGARHCDRKRAIP